MYLLVKPNGSKLWRLKYRFGGIEKSLSLGRYPETTLKEAGQKRDAARKLLDADPPIDPSVQRRAEKLTSAGSFRAVAHQWFELKQSNLVQKTRDRNNFILERLSERLGASPIGKIKTLDVKDALLAIQKQNGPETARRARAIAARVFAYAIAHGKASGDPTAGLRDILKERHTQPRFALTKPCDVGRLLQAIDGFSGQETTKAGLQLLALNFTRPTEMRLARWNEINFQTGLWEIPAGRMKMRRKNPQPHLLPLADQSLKILEKLSTITSAQDWVFPTMAGEKPLSENAFNNALKSIGFGSKIHTAHGFRATASTLLHEMNFSPELIETQLAHVRPGVAGVYNRSHLLQQRKEMLQAWADYLDQLRDGNNITPIRAGASA